MDKAYILEQFKFPMDPVAPSYNVVIRDHVRFTLLNEHVIRMEYSPSKKFEDRASQVILNRNFPKVNYQLKESETALEIKTDIFHLTYVKGQAFTKDTLKVRLLENNNYYRYGIKDPENLRSTNRTLDGVDGDIPLHEGLVSKNGYAVIDDSNSLVFTEDFWLTTREPGHIDLYYFGFGHQYKKAIQFFQKISGHTPMLPRFAFGNWWSRYYDYTEESLKDLIETFDQHNIPLSVCVIDMDWHLTDIPKEYGNGWTGFTWNKELFPDPKRMLDYLKDKNLKVALNLHPADGILPHEESYEAVATFMGIDPNEKVPIEFDCTDPRFMNAYFNLVLHPHEEIGVDFWWIDWQQGETSKIPGLDPLWMLNHTHFLDLARKNKRSIILSRWSGLGAHRYPIGFSGDTIVTWESLDFQPYFTATASNINYGYWSHDIGGHFLGKEEKELYIRWVQYGVFSPIFRLHSSKNPFTRREPWNWGTDALEIVRDFMQLRHQLIPYIYTMSYRNYHEGLPMILPTYYECDKQLAYEYKNQYYFGSELFIAPITKPMNQDMNHSLQELWLPDGKWYNFFNYRSYTGDRVYLLPFNIEQYPVFAKAGAIIPLSKDTGNTTDNPKLLEVKVFPGGNNTFKLYEDDGISNDYLNGLYTITTFDVNVEKKKLKFTMTFDDQYDQFIQDRTYRIHFVNVNEGYKIQSNVNYQESYFDHQLYVEFKKEQSTITFELLHDEQIEYVQTVDLTSYIHGMLFEAEINMILKERILQAIRESKDRYEMVSRLLSIRESDNDDIIDFITAIVVNS